MTGSGGPRPRHLGPRVGPGRSLHGASAGGSRSPGRSKGWRSSTVLAAVVAVAVLGAASCAGGAEVATEPPGSRAGGGSATSPPGSADVLAAPMTVGTAPGIGEGPTTTEAGPGPTGPSTTAPGPAPLPIGTLELPLVDTARPTVSRGTTIATSRPLPTVVAYPTGGGGPWPLVVFAHGYRLGPPGYARLIASLVAAGYVVAAPSFPLADEARAVGPVDRGDLPNQPADLTFVIDQVVAAGRDPSSPLAGRVDGTRVGAVGHSDGADVVLDLGYTAGRSDPRVEAIVALAPDAVVAPGSGVGAGTPLLVQHGDADDVVPYTESVSVFRAVPSRRYLLTLLGAGHLEPVAQSTAWTPVLDATVIAFLDRFVAGSSADEGAITGPASASTVARIDVAG